MSDLQQGAKKLNSVDVPPADSKDSMRSVDSFDQAAVDSLGMLCRFSRNTHSVQTYMRSSFTNPSVTLYETHDGDLDEM